MSTVDELLHHGIALQSAADLDGAADAFIQALDQHPGHPAALYSLAAIRLNQGKPGEALLLGEQCVRVNLASVLGWYIYSAALAAVGQNLQIGRAHV